MTVPLESLLNRINEKISKSQQEAAAAHQAASQINAALHPPSPPPISFDLEAENRALKQQVASLNSQLAEALDVASREHLAREQIEEWLFKALAEIDDLRSDLQHASSSASTPAVVPTVHVRNTTSPPVLPTTPHVKSSSLNDSLDQHESLSSLGRDLLRRTQKKMSPPKQSQSQFTSFNISPVRSIHWPQSNTHAFNQHKVSDGLARDILRLLRRSSSYLEHLSKKSADTLFEDEEVDADPTQVFPPGTPGTPAGLNIENIDLEAEVSTFIASMTEMFKRKCDDYENLVVFCKYLEDNVLLK
ncbi:hypothetical protein TL16_g02901 [Triparma laevis f. inornata]|uniref:Uncharacterized protein n=2 Tax=Triparma laevis TaxID=1534972 RepID=A0A9W7L0J7_9STRA|nr:hypothetical protein TL16_g02901 [Triparma laevis f. inornata]GMI17826.1 hypothetical protein TrLO_g1788 [Triparma laevis f. longispina]